MARWRQKFNEETGRSEFVPIDQEAARRDGHFVQGDIESFRSPLDGSVITDRKQYREHMEKHGVVPAAEFSPEFYKRKAKERADFYTGKRTKEQVRRDRMAINETINRLERAR